MDMKEFRETCDALQYAERRFTRADQDLAVAMKGETCLSIQIIPAGKDKPWISEYLGREFKPVLLETLGRLRNQLKKDLQDIVEELKRTLEA